MKSGPDRNEALLTLVNRLELLDRLCRSPAHVRDVIDETGQARSTVHRAVNELTELGFARRGDDGIEATITGRFARDQLTAYLDAFDDVLAAHPVLESLPTETAVEYDVVTGGEVLPAADPAPYRPADRIHEDLTEATSYRALLPTLEESRTVRVLYEHVVTRGNPAELVVSETVFRTLRNEFPRRMAVLAETDDFTVLVGEVPPYTLGLLDRRSGPGEGSATAAHVVVHNEGGGVHGLVANETDRAVSWATAHYERYRRDATDRTDALIPGTDGGSRAVGATGASTIGQSLPVSLEREGFVRIDDAYFRNEPVTSPATAWRTGLSLTEVHTGYAIARPVRDATDGTAEDGPELAADVAAELVAGGNALVLGPPGSGKSTVCKRVACEWYEAGRGPVVYREGDRGRSFASTDDLVATVAGADDHALVVVEDAVRPDANDVFEAIDRLAGRDDVSFLLDSREREWNAGPRRSTGGSELEIRHVPSMRRADCERLVSRFERTVGKPVDVSPDRLWSAIREGEATGVDCAPDGMLRSIHRLATYADPLADVPTALEEAVASAYEAVADDGVALSVAVLAHALNASGLGVDGAMLYAVADADSLTDVDAALDRLEGRVLFLRAGGRYRTVHEEWSTAFLARHLEAAGEPEAAERFGAAVTGLLALADDPDRCEAIASHLEDGASIRAIVDDPRGWADDAAEAVYTLADTRSNLAPLFGDGAGETVSLPAACSDEVAADRPIRLGGAFLAGGYYDRAERAFERLSLEETDHAVERHLGLARVGTNRGEYEEAIADCEDALSVLNDEGASTGSVRRARARFRLGEAFSRYNKYANAAAQYRAALEGFRANDRPRWTARTLLRTGDVACKRGEYDRARETYESCLGLVRELGDRRGEADVINNLGWIPWWRGENEAARAHFRRALELREAIGDRHGAANALYNLGLVANRQAQYELARELFERSAERFGDLGDRHSEIRVYGVLGHPLLKLGSFDRAREAFERWLALSRDLGDRHDESRALNNLALVAKRQGEYDLARESLERSLELKAEFDDGRGTSRTLNNLGEVELRRGRFDRASALFERSLARKEAFDGDSEVARTVANLGTVAVRRGEHDRAIDRFDRALELATRAGESDQVAAARVGLAEVATAEGAHDRASKCLEDALDTLEGRERTMESRIAVGRGRLALARGNLDDARSHGRRALEEFEALGATHWVGRSELLLGRVAAAAGDADLARERLLGALDAFEGLEAIHDAMVTIEILRETHEGDTDGVDAYRERALSVLTDAPEGVVDRHAEWLPGA